MDKRLSQTNTTDEDLVRLILADQDYFVELIDRYKVKLFNYIRRISGLRDEDVEDLLQEIFLKVYLNLNAHNNNWKFSSWIYSVAHNATISNHRKRSVRSENYQITIDEEISNRLRADINIEKDVDNKLLQEKVSKVLRELSETYREILILRYMDEKNYEEISDIIHKPVGTVGSLLNKAKKMFAEKYGNKFQETSNKKQTITK